MEESSFSRIKDEVATSMSRFLATELEVGGTLIHMARTTDDSNKKSRCIYFARKAYEAVEEFLPRSPLQGSEKEQIRRTLGSLKAQLEALGERFRAPIPIPQRQLHRHSMPLKIEKRIKLPSRARWTYGDAIREVKRFLVECRRLRAETIQILAQNKTIMQKRGRTTPWADRPHSPAS